MPAASDAIPDIKATWGPHAVNGPEPSERTGRLRRGLPAVTVPFRSSVSEEVKPQFGDRTWSQTSQRRNVSNLPVGESVSSQYSHWSSQNLLQTLGFEGIRTLVDR